MKGIAILILILAAIGGIMYATGQLAFEDGRVVYVPPPAHEDEHGHSGSEHGLSYCQTATQCAREIAQEHQARVGIKENGTELVAVRASDTQVVYEYAVPMTGTEFQRASPPPDTWFSQMRKDFCADPLNWPMTDLGVVTVMRFEGSDGSHLGEVRIEECDR